MSNQVHKAKRPSVCKTLSLCGSLVAPRDACAMIGMVLVTHGRLAVEFLAALEHVVGRQKQIQTVTIGPEDDMDMRRGEIIEAVREVDSGDGVVVLTDMFGGTPPIWRFPLWVPAVPKWWLASICPC